MRTRNKKQKNSARGAYHIQHGALLRTWEKRLLPRDADEYTYRSCIQYAQKRKLQAIMHTVHEFTTPECCAHELRHSNASSDPFAMSWLWEES